MNKKRKERGNMDLHSFRALKFESFFMNKFFHHDDQARYNYYFRTISF